MTTISEVSQPSVPSPTPTQRLAQVRGEVYRFCSRALEKPRHSQFKWLTSEAFITGLRLLCESFEVAITNSFRLPRDYAELESTYIACFDVGLPTPPVPLLASHYHRREPVPAIIHEHVLFYKRFGVKIAPGNVEPADHLSNELAFLIQLDELLEEGVIDPVSILQARFDFLSRQLQRWLPHALQTAREKELPEFYLVLLNLLNRAIAQDLKLVETELAHRHEHASAL